MRYIKISENKEYFKTTIEEKSFKKSMLKFFKTNELDIKLAQGDLVAFSKEEKKKEKSKPVNTGKLVEEHN